MTSQTVAQLLEELGVAKSHSRPHTSDDNPFSEAQFKTLKYRPDYPERFDSLAHAHQWATAFFDWYNNQHRHSNLGLMTPATVHWGLDDQLTANGNKSCAQPMQLIPNDSSRACPFRHGCLMQCGSIRRCRSTRWQRLRRPRIRRQSQR